MMVYRAITAMETLCWALYFSSIFLVGQYEAFVTIPASLVSTIYPPELGGSPPHLSSAAVSHSQCRTSLSLLPSQGRSSESIHEQQLCSLREALLKKKAEVEKEKKVLEELKQMEMDKSENNSLLPGSESTIERRQGNSSFLEGLSKHVLQGDNGAMCLKALAFRNGMNMTEANTYILQVGNTCVYWSSSSSYTLTCLAYPYYIITRLYKHNNSSVISFNRSNMFFTCLKLLRVFPGYEEEWVVVAVVGCQMKIH